LTLLVDAANVLGSRPNGWWRDRAGAARQFVGGIRAATVSGRLHEPVIVVVEGAARGGIGEGTVDGVEVVHAPGSGDDMIVTLVAGSPESASVVTADRELRRRVESLGASVSRPGWLLERLDP
jgi:hypothetical protein